ncbi:MAG: hypothetical protein K0R20_2756 [Actinomycetia bacterium]|jgi:hypothetical protein|nr:hypothetical protein [Actinomycetes bacterium]
MFWFVLAALLTISSALNAYQVIAVDDRSVQLLRGGLSVTLLLLAALSVRKGLATRSSVQAGTPGETAAADAIRQGMIIVGAFAAVIVAVVVVALLGPRAPSLTMPEQLAGHSRLHGPEFDDLQRSAEADVGGNPVVGVFAIGGQPRFMVAGFDRTLGPGEDLFTEIARTMEAGTGGPGVSFDVDAGTTRTEGPVTYTCVPLSMPAGAGAQIDSTICDWNDGTSYGLIWGFDPALDVSELASVAYDAIVD